jgi:uncharacterized protein YndB with AHSA1/START domain
MSAPTQTARTPRVEATLTRTFDAPRALVWEAWTDPQMMSRWWGPKGFTNPVCEIDVRVGGKILIHMRAPDGTVHPMTGTFDEVAEPECLVFRAVALDQRDTPLLESLTTVTFHDAGGKTKVIVHASAAPIEPIAAEMLKGMNEGWRQCLERLAELVEQQ